MAENNDSEKTLTEGVYPFNEEIYSWYMRNENYMSHYLYIFDDSAGCVFYYILNEIDPREQGCATKSPDRMFDIDSLKIGQIARALDSDLKCVVIGTEG